MKAFLNFKQWLGGSVASPSKNVSVAWTVLAVLMGLALALWLDKGLKPAFAQWRHEADWVAVLHKRQAILMQLGAETALLEGSAQAELEFLSERALQDWVKGRLGPAAELTVQPFVPSTSGVAAGDEAFQTVTLTLKGLPMATWMDWLAALRQRTHCVIQEMHLHSEVTGQVGQVVLRLPMKAAS
jgi:hypothetical protein